MIVEQRDWHLALQGQCSGSAIVRLFLLESDLMSLRFSLRDYRGAIERMEQKVSHHEKDWSMELKRAFHHAKYFVVCMRRFARLLEAAKGKKCEYPEQVADAIDQAWKANKVFFDLYREARDAIEHIDGEVNGANHRYMNMAGDSLEVVQGKQARVNQDAFDMAERAWKRVVDATLRPAEYRLRNALVQAAVRLLNKRIELLRSA